MQDEIGQAIPRDRLKQGAALKLPSRACRFGAK